MRHTMQDLTNAPLHRRICQCGRILWSPLNTTITIRCSACGETMANDCPDCPGKRTPPPWEEQP